MLRTYSRRHRISKVQLRPIFAVPGMDRASATAVLGDRREGPAAWAASRDTVRDRVRHLRAFLLSTAALFFRHASCIDSHLTCCFDVIHKALVSMGLFWVAGMADDYLSKEASLSYFELSQISYYSGLISQTHWLDRLVALSLMCGPDDATKAFASHLLRIEEGEAFGQWADREGKSEVPQSDEGRNESTIELQQDDDFGPLLRFMPSSSTGLAHWIFHQYDPDHFPSIPHGHYLGHKQPKLDAYLGWIYVYSKQTNRESKKKIIALWNDNMFRDFARNAINYYLTHHPHYIWRVPNPRRIPRRRP